MKNAKSRFRPISWKAPAAFAAGSEQSQHGALPVSPTLAALPLQEGGMGLLVGGASQVDLAAAVHARAGAGHIPSSLGLAHGSAESTGGRRCWGGSEPGWRELSVGGRMAVLGVGGIVMFIPLRSTPGTKQRPELPRSCVAPGAGWSPRIPPLQGLNFVLREEPGIRAFQLLQLDTRTLVKASPSLVIPLPSGDGTGGPVLPRCHEGHSPLRCTTAAVCQGWALL